MKIGKLINQIESHRIPIKYGRFHLRYSWLRNDLFHLLYVKLNHKITVSFYENR